MPGHRTIVKLAALAGLAVALMLASPSVAVAQEDGYEGDYEGCEEGYEGYEGDYEGCGEATLDESATPEDPAPASSGTLPLTGGVAVLGLAGAVAVTGLALRRLSRS